MNKTILAFGAFSLVALVGCNKDVADTASNDVALESLEQKVSYTIGLSVAQNVQIDKFAFDTNAFNLAVEDIKAGSEPRLTDDEMRATMQAFQTMQRELMAQEMREVGETNQAEGTAFLAVNATAEGVVQTESGLQYKILTEGAGAKPAASDRVLAHYRGTLLDGTEFDSSYTRGEPATFPVGGLIPGWIEALQLMPVGSKWELYVPSDLAYGNQGNGSIPPSSTLKFELELLEILGDEPTAAPAVQ